MRTGSVRHTDDKPCFPHFSPASGRGTFSGAVNVPAPAFSDAEAPVHAADAAQ